MPTFRIALRALAALAVLALAVPAFAARIPAALDPADLDPTCRACDDFFRFANGGFLKKNPIPAPYPAWGIDNLVAEDTRATLKRILAAAATNTAAAPESDEHKIGAYYKACLDEAAIEAAGLDPLREHLDAISGIDSVGSLVPVAAELASDGVTLGFGLDSEPDLKRSDRTIAGVGPTGLGMPDRDYYVQNDAATKAIRAKYLAYVASVLALAGDDAADAARGARDILALETVLAKATPPTAELRDPARTYHPMTLDALQALAPSVDWRLFAADTGAPAFANLNVQLPDFMRALERALTTTPVATWRRYATFRLVNEYAANLPKRFDDAHFGFYATVLQGTKVKQPRDLRCVRAVDGALGEALGAVYVAQAFPPAAKARALALVTNLQAVLRDDIGTLDWMSAPTKARAQRKLAAFRKKIGYPDKWRDYSALTIGEGPYALDALAAEHFETERQLAKIDKPTDRSEWYFSPPTFNAYYDAPNNEIVFPAGILRPPFFDAGADDAVNYGAIGAIIGHEMTHGFDDQGRKFDEHGNLTNWWTSADEKRFNARAQCIVVQFDAYQVLPGVHENGKLVQGEAIADLGGITIAWKAFQRTPEYQAHKKVGGYTPEQRFFLAYAQSWAGAVRPAYSAELVKTDPHPDTRYRVIGTLSNLPAFRAAFSCPAGSAMVRSKTCAIW